MERKQPLVVHDTADGDITQVLRRLVRDQAGVTEVLLVTHRSTRLPVALARRVRVVRERTPRAAAERARSLAAQGARLTTTGRTRSGSISACLIVKDEEDVLGTCLEAIAPFVDEIVVYDTGSTDSTVDVARRAGARVVEGYWDDHFGDARNRALEHCTMRWVVFVDADEVAEGDPAALRRRLDDEAADIVPVIIVSTTWSGGADGNQSTVRRVSRRTRVGWSGRIHEHMGPAAGVEDLSVSYDAAPLRLVHSGYQHSVVQDRQKDRRNVDLARTEFESPVEGGDRSVSVANYGRSLLLAGRTEEGLAVLDELKGSVGNPTATLGAARAAVEVLKAASRVAEVRSWLPVMASHGESRGNLDVVRAWVALVSGDAEEAAVTVENLPSGAAAGRDRDPWGTSFLPGSATSLRVSIDVALGDVDRAASRLREQIEEAPEQVDVQQLFTVMDAHGTPWSDVAATAPEPFLEKSLRDVVRGGRREALRWCEAFVAAHPGDYRPVVAACVLAGQTDLTTAITWSARALEAGVEGFSPLRDYVDQTGRTPVERAVALVVLNDAFKDASALADLVVLLPGLSTEERGVLETRCTSLGVEVPASSTLAAPAPLADGKVAR